MTLAHSPQDEAHTHREAETPVLAANPLEIAFGALWSIITPDPRIHDARRLISSALGSDGRRHGVQWAVQNLPLPTDADIARIDL